MNRRIYLSLGLLSASLIAFQLALMQLLSAVQWNHFAYMVISIALLGFGASGTFLALARKWLERHTEFVLYLLMILTGVSMSGIILFSSALFGKFDTYLIFVDLSNTKYLFLSYFSFFIPFFLGALAIGLIYIRYVNRIETMYFADLLGSGLGGVLLLGLLWIFYPAQLPASISILPIVAGILIIPKSWGKRLIIPSLLLLLLPGYLIVFPSKLPVSEFKDISGALNMPDSKIYREEKSPYGHIQVVEGPALRYAPGLSLSFSEDIPVSDVLFINGGWFGPITKRAKNRTTHFLDYTTHNLPYVISDPYNVLILDGRTGLHADHALWNGAVEVTLVEENKRVLDLLKNELAFKIDSLFSDPKLKSISLHSRSFLLADSSLYDLIVLPPIESFGGSSGVNALQEQYLLTLNAMNDTWDHLSDRGMIEVTSWMDYPVRNPLKILATLVETLEQNGCTEIEQHLVAIRSWGTISFVLKKRPFTSDEISRIKDFCQLMYFDPVLLPGITSSERSVFNHFEETSFFSSVDQIVSPERDSFYKNYDFNIKPATDNKPYFSQFLKLNRLNKLHDLFGQGALPFLEIGYFITLLTFIQISLIAFILIVFPLFFTQWKGKGKVYTLLHFSGIGIGFMFVEIVFIQQFILYFGNPIIAASAVLSGMLISSGVGSLFSSRLKSDNRNILIILSLVILFILFYAFTLTPVLRTSINLPFSLKILFSLLLISPLAFFMGMPFPIGLKQLDGHNNTLIPWAWGINGCFSVISTVLATIIAVEAGFLWVMLLASLAYGLALLANIFR
ncbi:MAG TPA: hypothetical protein VFD78_06635 [Chitinophagaceae bacterium]|nr:hypothetical protein [Chitinophagaceae bacterium]